MHIKQTISRRHFLKASTAAAGACVWPDPGWVEAAVPNGKTPLTGLEDLPRGGAPKALGLPHFPDRLHAFVWRNWPLVPADRMARVVGAAPAEVVRLGQAMGLGDQPPISRDQLRRTSLTIIRRNWHLLPYGQLLELLEWTPEQMAFTLREDDFFYIKLGSLKPQCEPIRYTPPTPEIRVQQGRLAALAREYFPRGLGHPEEPLFGFLPALSTPPAAAAQPVPGRFSPRFCYSYFALYGDPLLDPSLDPYPDGYLAQLAASGVDGVWLQGLLARLAPFPWDPAQSAGAEVRLANLRRLVERARRHGIGIYLYLNEPRALPLAFFQGRPELRGVTEGAYAALCISQPAVRRYLADSAATICGAVPDLAGLFTISGSENLTHCWSHGGGAQCPRCGRRPPAEVIAEANTALYEGIARSGARTRLLVWDWGWPEDAVEGVIQRLPTAVALMSVSEWSIPIQRGGVAKTIGEYSISTIGPGPRATRHWDLARRRGLKTLAKIQANNTWELSAVPYIPAVENVAIHAANLCQARVDGLMLGWTLGGHPSPNLEVVAETAQAAAAGPLPPPEEILARVARRRFGGQLAPAVVAAWRRFSRAFSEFPFDGGLVYNAPMQCGPANLLWAEPSRFAATMVGFPYDDLPAWCGGYPPEVFIGQFEKVAGGFEEALAELENAGFGESRAAEARFQREFQRELGVARAAAIHFRSTANQARFILLRQKLAACSQAVEGQALIAQVEDLLRRETGLARQLLELQASDSRLGFEASNQYYYVSVDLAEKIVNCRHLLEHWIPAQKARLKIP